jgi:hypothetical protein
VGKSGAHGRKYVITPPVTKSVVDLFEVIQVAHQRSQWRQSSGRLCHHTFERVIERPTVRETREAVGCGANLRESQVAKIPEDRCRLKNPFSDGTLFVFS